MAIITINGTTISGQKKLASLLSENLGYKAISKEIVDICSRKYNILQEDLLEQLEHVPGLWKRLSGKQHRDLIYIKCALLDSVKEDNVIYYGPLGQLFLSDLKNVLKIFIDKPFESRVADLMSEKKINRDEAIEQIKEFDQSKEKVIKMLYDVDFKSLSLYDISINLEKITVDTVADIVTNLIKSGKFQTNEKDLAKIKMISLENEIKAAIAADEKLWDQDITVKAKGSKIIVSGAVKNDKLKEDLIYTVKQVKGVNEIEFFVETLSSPIKIKPFTSS